MRWDLKKRICWKYLTIKNYLSLGTSLVDQPIYVYKLAGYGIVILKILFGEIDSIALLISGFIVGTLLIAILITLGWLWDKAHFFHLAQEWTNKRNPTLQEIKKNTKKRKV